MCCHTDQCCCGCTDQRTGMIIAGAIDLVMHLIFAVLLVAFVNPFNAIWSIVLIISDILLIIGASTRNSGCLIAYMVISMINIVFGFVIWIWSAFGFALGSVLSGSTPHGLIYVIIAVAVALLSYYIYLWVVVKSYQSALSGTGRVVVLQQPIIQQTVIVPPNQYSQQPPVFVVPPNQYPQQPPAYYP